MRENKFRAWCKSSEEMLSAQLLSEYGYFFCVFSGRFVKPEAIDYLPYAISYHWDENLVPLQFTGLKDKNGIEIYEGDLVDVRSIRMLCGGHGLIQFDDMSAGFKVKFDNQFLDVDLFNYIKIIGNIYENPELMEDKKL